MQLDMHYYGTFALARLAGLNIQAATMIATAAAFTDDAVKHENIRFQDGAQLDVDATAHHAVDVQNIKPDDQRKVWVPFHFFPGNQGGDYSERLICRKDSPLVQEMVARHLGQYEQPYYLALIGVTAHVYADTFAHYGFSGISSPWNRIDNSSFTFNGDLKPDILGYITGKAKKFFSNYVHEAGFLGTAESWLAESLSDALGHGAAATYPDRPYLAWGFQYTHPKPRLEQRDNHATFLEGCKALYTLFRKVAELRPDDTSNDGREFAAVEERLRLILATQAPMAGRIEAWQQACQAGDLYRQAAAIPQYTDDAWSQQVLNLQGTPDSRAILNQPVYQFYQAAAAHRTYAIRELFPAHGLVVG